MRCKVEFILIGLYGIRTHSHFVHKQTFSHSLILAYFFCQITELCYDYFMMHFTVFFFFLSHMRFRVNIHFRVASMSRNSLLETCKASTHYLKFKGCKGIWTQNHLFLKWTLNHFVGNKARMQISNVTRK